MKITDLQLSEYGIYRGASWQPSTSSLNVVMGENESGKTTMLRFIRDMLFGYGRGKWQGRKGNIYSFSLKLINQEIYKAFQVGIVTGT